MSGEYSVPCQRCSVRTAMQRQIANTIECFVFAASTVRTRDAVRLCSSCFRTVGSLIYSLNNVKHRKPTRGRGDAP
jgi:hypothetical protein